MTPLEDLLQQCTVKIMIPGGWGTGFFVAPGLMLTCAHVVRKAVDFQVTVVYPAQQKTLLATVQAKADDGKTLDLALIQLVEPLPEHPCVLLDEEPVAIGQALYSYGYLESYTNAAPVRPVNEGWTGDTPPLLKLQGAQIEKGISGAALLNLKTGKICGMVKETRAAGFDLGGGAIPTRVILEQFPQLRDLQREFHGGVGVACPGDNRRWSSLISESSEIDFQPYLQSVITTYAKWWQLYTLSDAAGKLRQEKDPAPMFDFGLMVQTVVKETQEQENAEGAQGEKEKIERFSVLEGIRKYADQQVLLVGRPGSGKSTALARLLLEEAATQNSEAYQTSEVFKTSEVSAHSPRIPVLVELRYWQGALSDLIHSAIARHDPTLKAVPLDGLLTNALLLFDGVNELPSEEARSQLIAFRRNHPKLPMIFTTRDLSLGGDLGIEQKLEMQPLTEPQMQAFIRAYVPGQAEAMLRQLKARLREFGRTPLLLWMLCEVFQQAPNNQLPSNLGGVFQAFTKMYEESSVRKHEVALLKGDVRPLSDRRLWKKALIAIAAIMMQGKTPVDFRVAIHRDEVERELSQVFPNEKFPVRDILDDLLKYHLLQNQTTDQIQFRHQLIQEYYAAEYLLRLSQPPNGKLGLTDEQLKRDYLNYLKWTEPISLMLALEEKEAQALRVVKLALDVNQRLGARLSGEVQPTLQAKTVSWIKELSIPELLKVELLSSTKSVEAMPVLIRAIQHSDFSVRWATATALGQIDGQESVQALLKASKDPAPFVSLAAIGALGVIGNSAAIEALLRVLGNATYDDFCLRSSYELGKLGNEIGIQKLREALNHQGSLVIRKAISALKLLNTEASNSVLLEALEHPKNYVRMLAVQALGEIGNDAWVPDLLKVLEHEDSRLREIVSLGESVISALERMGGSKAISALLSIAENQNLLIRRRVLELFGSLTCKAAIPILKESLQDRDVAIRGIAATSLGQMGDELVVPDLLQALEDDDSYVRENAAKALGRVGSREAVLKLSQMLTNENYFTCLEASGALGKIGGEKTVTDLLKLLEHPNSKTQQLVAKTLGMIGDRAAIPGLIKALKRQEESIAAQKLELTNNEEDDLEIAEELEEQEEVIVALAAALVRLNCCIGTLILIGKLENLTPHGFIWDYFSFDLFRDLEIEGAIPVLLKALESQSIEIHRAAVSILDSILRKTEKLSEELLPVIRKTLKNADELTCTIVISILHRIDSEGAASEILKFLDYPHITVQIKAASVLAERGNEAVLPLLLEALDSEDVLVRRNAASALIKLGSEAVVTALLPLLSNENSKAQKEIVKTLESISNPKALTELQKLELKSPDYEFSMAIASIQNRCQFYNYEIWKEAKAIQNEKLERQKGKQRTTGGQATEGTYVAHYYEVKAEVFQVIENNHGKVIGKQSLDKKPTGDHSC